VISLTPPPAPASAGTDSIEDDDVFDPNALVIEEPDVPSMGTVGGSGAASASSSSGSGSGLGASPFDTPVESDPSDAAEIARQLANLSPKAAKAVAAAAKATTPEERERALAEVDDDEDPINRDLLIKFLGSVNS
jgi:hypothetical protein